MKRALGLVVALWLGLLANAAWAQGVVPVRFGSHPTFERMVFDWTQPIEYRIDQQGARASIAFERAAEFDLALLRRGLRNLATDVTLSRDDKRTTILLALAEGWRIRHLRSGTKVVVDFSRAEAAARVEVAPPRPQAPAAPPAPAARAAGPPMALTPLVAAPAPVPQRPTIGVELVRSTDGQAIRINWTEPTGLAVFQRGPAAWLVFDRPGRVDFSRVSGRRDGPIARADVVNGDGAAVRLVFNATAIASISQDGHAWVVEFAAASFTPAQPARISVREDGEPPMARVMVEMTGAESIIMLKDPEIGDMIAAAPSRVVGAAATFERGFTQFRILPALQGAAVVVHDDGVRVTAGTGGVTVSHGAGLAVSVPRTPARAAGSTVGQPLLDFASWRRGGAESYSTDRQALHRAVVAAPDERRTAARLALARHAFAFGEGAEALGLLSLIERDNAALASSPSLALMRGAAALMMGDVEAASRELRRSELEPYAEARYWRGALALAEGDGVGAKALTEGLDWSQTYPPPYAHRLGLDVAEVLLAGGDGIGAERRIEQVAAQTPSASERARIAWLRGRLFLARNDNEKANAAFTEAEQAAMSPARVQAALDRIELDLARKTTTAEAAAERLAALSLTWRGDDLEFTILARLGRARIEAGDPRGGLSVWRDAVTRFPQHPRAREVIADMRETFRAIYLEGGADRMSPVAAIALHDEFSELSPPGEPGDDIGLRLVERLVAIDLLDRAAEMLGHLIKFRLEGDAKARASLRLAEVRLLDGKPPLALEALAGSESGSDPALAVQRRHLAARALSAAGRHGEALASLASDGDGEGLALRAELAWRVQDWREVADALSALVGDGATGPIDATKQGHVLRLAVALALARDEAGLAKVKAGFGAAMAAGANKELFGVITHAPAGGRPSEMREIADRVAAAAPFQGFLAGLRRAPARAGG